MSEFILKAGTIVKHGTSSLHLPSILKSGLVARHSRHQLRTESEKFPELEGVYVGELSAYFGAYAAHGAILKDFVLATPHYKAMAQEFFQAGRAARGKFDVSSVPMSAPVILNIRLEEDVVLVGDEDYLNLDSESGNDEQVWNRWKAGCVLQAISPSWIESFEYPRLISVEDIGHQRKLAEISRDMKIMVIGAASVSEKIPPSKLMQNGKITLSQVSQFSQRQLDYFFSIKPFSDHENRFLNGAIQAAVFNQTSEEIGFDGIVF